MREKRTEVLLVTPIRPMVTGLATYAQRVLEATCEIFSWIVAYPEGGDPKCLPDRVRAVPISELDPSSVPVRRIFQLGNSQHCFPVLQALYRLGGTSVFHEVVLHHMIRESCMEDGRIDQYREELRFNHGPGAEGVERELSNRDVPEREYDAMLKKYPLIGRALRSSWSAACLSEYAASKIRGAFLDGALITIGHPLSPLPELRIPEKPFPVCVGMVGSNHPGRNLDSLMEAVSTVRKRKPEMGLVLIGSGYPDDLPEWAVKTGRLDEAEYQSWIRAMDMVMDLRHPTCGETSGSLLEAMRAGIPCIVTASGSFINLPSDGVIRVPTESIVNASAQALDLLLGEPELGRSISNRARKYAEEEGSMTRLTNDWKKLVETTGAFMPGRDVTEASASVSPAWDEPPEGFIRDTATGPVTWAFSGESLLRGPMNSKKALLTVWGSGTVNGRRLPAEPSVLSLETDGGTIKMTGEGWISNVFWE